MTHDHDPSPEWLLNRWLDDMTVLVARLEQVHLPDGFAVDYSPASLAALEQVLINESGGPDADFVRAALGYVGEILMDTCGGRWDVDADVDPVRGDPVVRPDPALGLAPLSVSILIDVAVAERSGEVFAREREQLLAAVADLRATAPDWQPYKERSPLDPLGPQPEDPWLAGWLLDRKVAFPAWAEKLEGPSGAGRWDFSEASLDLLERHVRARYDTLRDFDAERDRPFLTGAVWYLGQFVCLQRDSVWLYWAVDPDAEPGSHHRSDNPWSGIPFTHQPHKRNAVPVDPMTQLRGLVRYGAGHHLLNVLDSVR